MSINILKMDLEKAIKTNDYNKTKILLNRFDNPEDFIFNNDITTIQEKWFDFIYQYIITNRTLYNNPKFRKKKKEICRQLAIFLYKLKSTGWYTGLRSVSSLRLKRPSNDHIFPRMIIAEFYLTLSNLSLDYFKYSFRHLFGLTNKVTSDENKKMNISLNRIFKKYSSQHNLLNVVPNLLPIIAYCYKDNNIKLQNNGNHQIPINNLKNFVDALFL